MSRRFEVLGFSVIICFLTALLYFNTSVVPQIQVFVVNNIDYEQSRQRHSSQKHFSSFPEWIRYQKIVVSDSVLKVDSNKLKKVKSEKILHRKVSSDKCSNFKNEEKFDCYPDGLASKERCQARGCCWSPVVEESSVPLNVPWCYYSNNYTGYIVNAVTYKSTGVRVRIGRNTKSYYPGDVMSLIVDVFYLTESTLRIKIYDADKERYEVPLKPSTSQPVNETLYSFVVSRIGEPFNLMVMRKTVTGLVPIKILDTNNAAPFIFADQFIQFSSFLPSPFVYGLGERRGSLLHNVNWTRVTMWNKDQPPREKTNLYGSHPFYMVMEERDSTSHGVFLLNSNAMDVVLQPAPAITWRTIGGIIDLFVFIGPHPGDVIQQYTEVIGHSFMPPYWSLGYHLCRWGYKTANKTLAITNRVRAAGIPQDVQWNDIDYMDKKLDFTTAREFGDQNSMVSELHRRGMHYVMIVDPGISDVQSPGAYYAFDHGMKLDIFIKNSVGKPLEGKVWPGNTYFPDFTNPMSQQYWTDLVKFFQEQVPFDGMWVDMNEISNFVAGSTIGCPKDSNLENPPYVPAVAGGSLRFSTICASAKQNLSTAYNVHNLYGLTETMASYRALLSVRGKRPFVISRSTFAGQGQFGGHWSGDNFATYKDMYYSIPEILNFNMFGISMMGVDICGFQLDTTEQLCTRWHQLGAFYPFSRNHNSVGLKDQDPGAFSQTSIQAVRKAYLTRYSLLPYLYTLFHKSNAMGYTVARPLFFEFSPDHQTYSIDKQFLWGPALMITPVLLKDAVSVNAYFPFGSRWYDFYTGQHNLTQGFYHMLPAPLDHINLHVRGGYIIPMQEPALTTTESRKNPFKLLAALDETGSAEGDLFWDDGDTVGTHESGKFNMLKFNVSKQALQSQIFHQGYSEQSMVLGNVTIYGVEKFPTSVHLNGQLVNYTYNVINKILNVGNLKVNMLTVFNLVWM